MTHTAIEGVIGVGKTALTRKLGEQRGVHTFFEQFEDNPFLNSFTQGEHERPVCVPPSGESHQRTKDGAHLKQRLDPCEGGRTTRHSPIAITSFFGLPFAIGLLLPLLVVIA